MGTPGGEPKVLLNALKPMLGVVGDIKTSQEVLRVIGMMKDAEKLMSRCVYLNILKATCRQAKSSEEKKTTLERFLLTGGWGILNKWLVEFTRSQNYPVLLELIDVLKIMPVTVDLLKQGNTGKLMKQMTKLENAEVKKSSLQLIKQWKGMIRGGNESQDSIKRARDDTKPNGEKPEKRAKTIPVDKLVSDSSGFMNALNAVTTAPAKKKKRTNSKDLKTTLPLDEILKPSDEKKLKLESEGDKIGPENPPSPDTNADELSGLLFLSPAVEAANQALKEFDNTVIVDEGSLARKKNKKKRNITWATDDKLVQISYFELLPGERKGVHMENFSLARQHELLLEKQTLKNRRSEDKMVELVQWNRLIPMDNAGVPNFMPGDKSREKYLQAEREKNVLAFIFLTRESLPNSPAEPDFDADEHSARTQPRPIPHDEDGTLFPTKNVNNTPVIPAKVPEEDKIPSPTTKAPRNPADVSPAVQNIMATLMKNGPPNQNGTPSIPITNTVSSPVKPAPMNNNTQSNITITKPQPNINEQPTPIPSILDSNIPNPRGRGGAIAGPRFRGGGRGNGGNFNNQNGGGPRQRWEGSQNMPPQEDWNNYENHDGNNYNYNEGYENNYHGGKSRSRGGGHFRNEGGPGGFNPGNRGGNGRGGRGFFRGGNRGGGINRGGGSGNWGNNPNINNNRNGPPGSRGKAMCQHFSTARGCRNGDRCNFLHVRR